MTSDEYCIWLKVYLKENSNLSTLDQMVIRSTLDKVNKTTNSKSPMWAPGVIYKHENK